MEENEQRPRATDAPHAEIVDGGMPGKTVLVRATIRMPDGQSQVALLEVNVQALARALMPALVAQIALATGSRNI